jgi:RNA polymerase sigma factor (sigma-70 family)
MNVSDAELVERVRCGERDAFGVLIERYRARAVGLACSMLGDFAEAEDVVQEALYQAYFGLDRLKDASRFGSWLFGIAVNLAKMALRRRRYTISFEDWEGGRVAHGFDPDDATPEAEVDVRELRDALRAAIEQLPETMRVSVWMHYVEGLSYREIAAMFGVAPGALRVQTHRARERLRAALIAQWREHVPRQEAKMIEVTVADVMMWMPQDWKPDPAMKGRLPPELPGKLRVVLLQERDGDRTLPIWIGPFEADTLLLHLAQVTTLRPLTIDFFMRVFEATDVKVDRVAITELKDETFIATVTIRSGQKTHDLDARPSDAINLAVRANVPILLDEAVMQQAGGVVVGEPGAWLEARESPRPMPREEGHEWRSGFEFVRGDPTASTTPGC